jgi:hypothetical protein
VTVGPKTRLAVIGAMETDLLEASKPGAFRPVHLCSRDCSDQKQHNENAYQVASDCQYRYVEAAQRRLQTYKATGEITSR